MCDLKLPLCSLTLLFSFVSSTYSLGAGTQLISSTTLEDKIRGGMLAQIIGNLNGLPHEMKYIHEPGTVRDYVPSLPQGARTDDDTDLEWMYVLEIAQQKTPFISYPRVVELWKNHVNTGVWCANEYARELMQIGFLPPLTGSSKLNPWSDFNLSGQFVCETFGLMCPGMPQTASQLGLHYTRVSIDGEPAQATQFFTTMIAMAFFEDDLEALLDAGERAIDPDSRLAVVVVKTRKICAEHPDDWQAARRAIKQDWQVHQGGLRDWNGYELNTACTVASLIYGAGDLVKTLQLAFNMGWDCDNNAATAATIVGVIKGRKWIDSQGWNIVDRYANTTRAGLPQDETISSFEGKVLECALLVIQQQGGVRVDQNGEDFYRIRLQQPKNVESLSKTGEKDYPGQAPVKDGNGADTLNPAQEAYLSICSETDEALSRENPERWSYLVDELHKQVGLRKCVAQSPHPSGNTLRSAYQRWGLDEPQSQAPHGNEK